MTPGAKCIKSTAVRDVVSWQERIPKWSDILFRADFSKNCVRIKSTVHRQRCISCYACFYFLLQIYLSVCIMAILTIMIFIQINSISCIFCQCKNTFRCNFFFVCQSINHYFKFTVRRITLPPTALFCLWHFSSKLN